MTPAAAAAFLTEHAIETVEVGFCDTYGILRGKRVSAPHFLARLASGFSFATAILCTDMWCDLFPGYQGQDDWNSFATGYTDFQAVPDLATLCLVPWRERTALVLCDLYEHGALCRLGPRTILRQIAGQVHALGYEAQIASELEFYLLSAQTRRPLFPQLQTYSLTRGGETEAVMLAVRRSLERMGIPVEACNSEHGPAQVELTFGHAPPLLCADRTVLFKYAVKDIARQHGLLATFMPKPLADQSGNGYHVHQSLWDRQGRNLFADATGITAHWLAGLMQHMREFYVLGAVSINAYKRQRSYTFSPTKVIWGGDNRTVAVRSLIGEGAGSRLEQRCGSADANPYLIIAASLAAGLAGIAGGLTPPPPTKGDAYLDDAPDLPHSLSEALDLFEASAAARQYFGAEFINLFVGKGRHEVDLFQAAITDWEFNRYVEWA